ncbi:MAG: hypothetical protein ACKOAR_11465, partial [Bacteroidota bacterium]
RRSKSRRCQKALEQVLLMRLRCADRIPAEAAAARMVVQDREGMALMENKAEVVAIAGIAVLAGGQVTTGLRATARKADHPPLETKTAGQSPAVFL